MATQIEMRARRGSQITEEVAEVLENRDLRPDEKTRVIDAINYLIPEYSTAHLTDPEQIAERDETIDGWNRTFAKGQSYYFGENPLDPRGKKQKKSMVSHALIKWTGARLDDPTLTKQQRRDYEKYLNVLKKHRRILEEREEVVAKSEVSIPGTKRRSRTNGRTQTDLTSGQGPSLPAFTLTDGPGEDSRFARSFDEGSFASDDPEITEEPNPFDEISQAPMLPVPDRRGSIRNVEMTTIVFSYSDPVYDREAEWWAENQIQKDLGRKWPKSAWTRIVKEKRRKEYIKTARRLLVEANNPFAEIDLATEQIVNRDAYRQEYEEALAATVRGIEINPELFAKDTPRKATGLFGIRLREKMVQLAQDTSLTPEQIDQVFGEFIRENHAEFKRLFGIEGKFESIRPFSSKLSEKLTQLRSNMIQNGIPSSEAHKYLNIVFANSVENWKRYPLKRTPEGLQSKSREQIFPPPPSQSGRFPAGSFSGRRFEGGFVSAGLRTGSQAAEASQPTADNSSVTLPLEYKKLLGKDYVRIGERNTFKIKEIKQIDGEYYAILGREDEKDQKVKIDDLENPHSVWKVAPPPTPDQKEKPDTRSRVRKIAGSVRRKISGGLRWIWRHLKFW